MQSNNAHDSKIICKHTISIHVHCLHREMVAFYALDMTTSPSYHIMHHILDQFCHVMQSPPLFRNNDDKHACTSKKEQREKHNRLAQITPTGSQHLSETMMINMHTHPQKREKHNRLAQITHASSQHLSETMMTNMHTPPKKREKHNRLAQITHAGSHLSETMMINMHTRPKKRKTQ